jgi:steroid delta-isomerase-like uncharacterized protein
MTDGSKDFDLEAFLGDLFGAFNNHDVDKIVAMHTADAEWEDPSVPAPIKGPAAIAEHLEEMFKAFPDLKFDDDFEVYRTGGSKAAASWRFTGTMLGPMNPPGFAPTGKKAAVKGACLYDFVDGRVARHHIIYDAMGMLEQLGIMPSLESASGKLTVGLQRATARFSRGMHRAAS